MSAFGGRAPRDRQSDSQEQQEQTQEAGATTNPVDESSNAQPENAQEPNVFERLNSDLAEGRISDGQALRGLLNAVTGNEDAVYADEKDNES